MTSKSRSQSALLSKYLDLYKKKPTSRVFAPLAEVYRKLGLMDEALKILKEGIKYHPQYALGYLVLAQCYHDQGKLELTLQTLRPFKDLHRDNIVLQRLFADVCYDLSQFEEALETYKFILFLNPKDAEIIQKVTELESKLEVKEEQRVLLKSPSPERLNKSVFDEDDDQWVQVNFNQPSNPKKLENNEWQMKPPQLVTNVISPTFKAEEIQVLERSLDDDFFSDDPDMDDFEEENELSETSAPVVSLTLVDLYIEQNYLDKAQEILEKILEVNPADQQSLNKLRLIKTKKENDPDEHDALINLINKTVHNPEKDKLKLAYETFLKMIQEKSRSQKEHQHE